MAQQVILGDCLKVIPTLAESSIDLIVSDPPYHRVKDESWDKQWKTDADYLAWIGDCCAAWRRVLKPNGSLYVFASPQMAWGVEGELRKSFNVLNQIIWAKRDRAGNGIANRSDITTLRAFFPQRESIFLAEHFGADGAAMGESGYTAKCDELRGFVFEALLLYLEGERKRAGIDKADCNEACGFSPTPGGMASRHYFSPSQWCLPTEKHYAALQVLFNAKGRRPAPPYAEFHTAPRERFERRLRADYEYLRADYEDLRADYEDLRRPFTVTADQQYTDVWDFPTVAARVGKHPCAKPVALCAHIVNCSSRPGAVVLDPFAGGGTLGEVCRELGREYIGIERDPDWHAVACRRAGAERMEAGDELPAAAFGHMPLFAESSS
jgi:adenine-specific DNA-methyltransferase